MGTITEKQNKQTNHNKQKNFLKVLSPYKREEKSGTIFSLFHLLSTFCSSTKEYLTSLDLWVYAVMFKLSNEVFQDT